MCMLSLVVEGWTNPGPNQITWTPNYPTVDMAKQMLDIMVRLDAIDKKLGALDCLVEAKAKRKLRIKLRKRASKT